MNKIILSTILLLLTTALSVKSENDKEFHFRHLNSENGLSQNSVFCILQDRSGFMWFGTKGGLNRYDGNSVKVFRRDENDPNSLGNNSVLSLLEMSDGEIWVGTERGIYIYNPVDEKFRFFDLKNQEGHFISSPITDMKIDHSGNIWIAGNNLLRYSLITKKVEIILYLTLEHNKNRFYPMKARTISIDKDEQVWFGILNDGVRRFNPIDNKFTSYTKDELGKPLIYSSISRITSLDNDNLLVGSMNDGLRIMNKTTEKIKNYSLGEGIDGEKLQVRAIKVISDSSVWIGTESGLYVHNPKTKETKYLKNDIGNRFSLSDNAIYSIYKDREGGVWVGTYFSGVNYYPAPYDYFDKYYPIPGKNSISGQRVSGICEDKEGNLWIGTEDAGLNKLNLKTRLFEHIQAQGALNGLNYHNIHDVMIDGDNLWIATFSHGINVLNLKTNKWTYYKKGDKLGMLNDNNIFSLFRDSANRIWIGTSSGAFLYDRDADNFIKQEKLLYYFISDIIEDRLGQIWFSTYGRGVYCYNSRINEYTHYTYNPKDTTSLCYHRITAMTMDNKKQLWFASESGGICMFEEETKKFIRYGLKDGFLSDDIYKILADDEDNLWLSSNTGLIKFNPENKQIQIFTQGSGLLGNQFNYKSGFKDHSGRLYFGTLNGLISFKPADFLPNHHIPPVVITDFKLLNNEIPETDNKLAQPNVTLNYKQSSFSITFSSLSYVAPEMNRYAYKMEGLDKDWIYITSPQKITYSNLHPDDYKFMVKASNNDGVWNDIGDALFIKITPPFWNTKLAYLIYLVLLLLSIILIIYYYKRRIELDNKEKRVLYESQKEKETYDAKINFFTNITHEIRTPLTLIKGPLEYMLNTELSKKELMSNLFIMDKNTNRLLVLINQLLDFRKTESKVFSITFSHININELLDETYTRFKPMAIQKSLNFIFEPPYLPISADVDKEALTKIISNLFTNAIKNASKEIITTLTDSQDHIEIRVTNDGKNISDDLKDKIFEAFYQIQEPGNVPNSGSGIGLALVKSLVELHEGKVFLDTDIADLNSFVVQLPKGQQDVAEVAPAESIIKEEASDNMPQRNTPSYNADQYSILMVEDNEELLQFTAEKLDDKYNVFMAKDGIEAIDILEETNINLVVTDIMMPRMDGLELTKTIKEDMKYSHIPVILLTASTNARSKIDGLESGADAYIEKPFSLEYLQARISNLLYNRKKVKEAFANSPFVHTSSMALTKSDEEFLNKMTEIIYNNIPNVDFNVDQLAEELFMSRSSLLRKIRGISDTTPNDFIRLMRLKRAAEILQEGEYRVNEVCYLVGFLSTSYFSKVFQKQFGVLPKDFVKNLKK